MPWTVNETNHVATFANSLGGNNEVINEITEGRRDQSSDPAQNVQQQRPPPD